jgi:hypothetical protein
MVDKSKLAVSGHSAGGAGSVIAASNEARFNVCIPVAPALTSIYSEVGPNYAINVHIPILLAVGGNDRGSIDYVQLTRQAYNESNTPKFLVVALDDDHSSIIQESISFKYIISFLKVYLCGKEEYIPYLYGEYAQQDVDEGYIEVISNLIGGKSDFKVSNLVVDPDSVNRGDPITVSIDVSNTGTKAGDYTVYLKVNEEVIEEKTMSLDAGSFETVFFEMIYEEVGEYSVEVNGVNGSFKVNRVQTGISAFPLVSVIIGLIISILVINFSNRRLIN